MVQQNWWKVIWETWVEMLVVLVLVLMVCDVLLVLLKQFVLMVLVALVAFYQMFYYVDVLKEVQEMAMKVVLIHVDAIDRTNHFFLILQHWK